MVNKQKGGFKGGFNEKKNPWHTRHCYHLSP
jgi:hypothetical protein